jgi:catechol 2,3-dioxygenase-like lactoylglutathione lyase family enzyme
VAVDAQSVYNPSYHVLREKTMAGYVEPNEQLIVELYTADIKSSIEFYRSFGFEIVREESNFVVLRWDESMLFLEEVKDCPPPERNVGNIRIMVTDVDRYWELSLKLGVRVISPIKDSYYGLRDFTIVGPDGLGLRFATRLAASH